MKRRGAFDYLHPTRNDCLVNPSRIAGMFWLNEEYDKGEGWDIRLDGVV